MLRAFSKILFYLFLKNPFLMKITEIKWLRNYELLKAFVIEHHHLPDKRRVENRGLLNWWKYNQKLIKQGKLSDERIKLLKKLSEMRKPMS